MNFPVHQPYKDGKGGVEIGLKPIPENSWLEIDELFPNEIALKKKAISRKKTRSINHTLNLNIHPKRSSACAVGTSAYVS